MPLYEPLRVLLYTRNMTYNSAHGSPGQPCTLEKAPAAAQRTWHETPRPEPSLATPCEPKAPRLLRAACGASSG